ncbi:DUF1573 domain-containing protein [Flavobacterium subsaxonicum]|uniref:DUF1573 domain-containing protein n=1 Tax=Flavobacterium subsaxonicum WB 4.1-42 = DSM 21790 TaxID=1121898 RepID=A0A0A2MQM4_9FLAO|nr:DUF1573 domain-containing protein [Flavobacterium subsaxonicum]KGO93748.1 hypothetical protein Q766_07285 [Flavobacterium subsaxonicum WB 4.1-42 = DSM 21790]
MIKKSIAMLAMASLVLASCKKENAALRIDDATAKKAELAHAESGKLPVAKFETMDHDFGTINAGEKVNYTYKFKNEGTAPLLISDAKASCGCTVPSYTKEPVQPGATGEVQVIFDSTGKSGDVQKTVTLTLNTEKGTETLNFKAKIETKGIGTNAMTIGGGAAH